VDEGLTSAISVAMILIEAGRGSQLSLSLCKTSRVSM
jgi:hypothetical protein